MNGSLGKSKTERSSLYLQKGFTLIEVTVAVAILGVGLTTLIALQSRLLDTFLYERNSFKAALYAQYLMTFIEVKGTAPEVGEKNYDLYDELSQRGYFDGNHNNNNFQEQLRDWKANIYVKSWDYEDFKDVMREVKITISWGDSPRENYQLITFFNKNS